MYPELGGPLYHGSALEVREVNVTLGAKRKDFGRGFYTTSSKIQAEKFASLRAHQQASSQGFVSIFSYEHDPSLRVKRFEGADIAWLDYIVMNRNGDMKQLSDSLCFDIVIGPVADDAVGLVVNNFLASVYGDPDTWEAKSTAIRLLESEKLRNQVFFGSEKAAACLRFREVYSIAAHR